jgi:hypothetical protein
MLNNLYVAIVAGGFARLTSVSNAFANNNSFNSFLPTSTIAISSSVNELINRTIANLYYGQITTGVTNTWASTNNFQNSSNTASLTVTQNESAPSYSPLLKLTNLQSPQSIIFFLLNAIAGSANTCVQAGDAVMYSNPTPLVLTIAQTGGTGVRITSSDVALTGATTSINSTTNTMAGTTNNVNGVNVFIAPSSALQISAPTTNIIGTNVNVTSTGTLAIGSPTTTTFVNLPSTTTTFTTATANQFITKNIGDTLYADEVTGGYARLSTIDNTFTNNNTFGGSNTTINSTTTTIAGTTCNINASSATVVKNGQTATSSAIAFSVVNSIVSPNPNSVNIACNLGAGNYNPSMATGDSAIISGGAVGTSVLNLTAHSNTAVGVKINATGTVDITGSTSINGSFSGTSPMTTTYAVNPTLTINQIGFSIQQSTYTADAANANVDYNLHTITFPSLGVWLVNAQIFVNTAVANAYYRISLSYLATAHDYRNIATTWSNYASLTDDIGVRTMIVDSYTPSSQLYVIASSNRAQFTSAIPPYLHTYNINVTMTKLG